MNKRKSFLNLLCNFYDQKLNLGTVVRAVLKIHAQIMQNTRNTPAGCLKMKIKTFYLTLGFSFDNDAKCVVTFLFQYT